MVDSGFSQHAVLEISSYVMITEFTINFILDSGRLLQAEIIRCRGPSRNVLLDVSMPANAGLRRRLVSSSSCARGSCQADTYCYLMFFFR